MYKIGDRVIFSLASGVERFSHMNIVIPHKGVIVNKDEDENWYCIEFDSYIDSKGMAHSASRMVKKEDILDYDDNAIQRLSRRIKNVAK